MESARILQNPFSEPSSVASALESFWRPQLTQTVLYGAVLHVLRLQLGFARLSDTDGICLFECCMMSGLACWAAFSPGLPEEPCRCRMCFYMELSFWVFGFMYA